MSDDYLEESAAFRATGESLLRDGAYAAVAELARRRRRRSPGDVTATVLLCRALLGAGDFAALGEELSALEAALAELTDVYAALGERYRRQGNLAQAHVCERKAAAFAPALLAAAALEEKADFPRHPAGQGMEAHRDIRALLEDCQCLTLIELYLRQGQLDMAAQLLAEIVQRDGLNTPAAELLRLLQTKRGRTHGSAKTAAVLSELNRWLRNIARMRYDAG